MNNELQNIKVSQWWRKHRKHYNVSLVVAGVLAFISTVAVVFSCQNVISNAEITILTVLLQGFGYLIMIGIANLCFYAGPISERLIKPQDPDRFRTVTYRMGYWFSVLLPLCIPSLLLYLVVFHPEYWNN
jgi:hypothetical protein